MCVDGLFFCCSNIQQSILTFSYLNSCKISGIFQENLMILGLECIKLTFPRHVCGDNVAFVPLGMFSHHHPGVNLRPGHAHIIDVSVAVIPLYAKETRTRGWMII